MADIREKLEQKCTKSRSEIAANSLEQGILTKNTRETGSPRTEPLTIEIQ
jgi:hypothetical protein